MCFVKRNNCYKINLPEVFDGTRLLIAFYKKKRDLGYIVKKGPYCNTGLVLPCESKFD